MSIIPNTEVVHYSYDSWGRLLNIGGTLAGTVGVKNSIRYRGYYYDTETGLYYLQSRYYKPDFGRFISSDDPVYHNGMTGIEANLYAYCGNDPINKIDPDGHLAFVLPIIGVGVGLIGLIMLTISLIALGIIGIYFAATFGKYLGNILAQYEIENIKNSIPTKLKTFDGRIDLSKFTNRNGPLPPKGPRGILGPLGYYLLRDLDSHSGGIWKLFDWAGRRIATLLGDGTIIGK